MNKYDVKNDDNKREKDLSAVRHGFIFSPPIKQGEGRDSSCLNKHFSLFSPTHDFTFIVRCDVREKKALE